MARAGQAGGTTHRDANRTGTVTLDVHRPLEAAIGIVLVFVPLLIGVLPGGPETFTTGAAIIAVVCGLVLTTLGFAGTRDRDGVGPGAHARIDVVTGAVLVGAGIFFAAQGETASVLLLGLSGLVFAVLVALTRYTTR